MLYELDLGLNHVKRKSAEPIDNGANLLIPVPATSPTPKPTDQPFSYGPGKLLLTAMRSTDLALLCDNKHDWVQQLNVDMAVGLRVVSSRS